jgi:hypothetical protein
MHLQVFLASQVVLEAPGISVVGRVFLDRGLQV